jgi:hypothetical protein
VGLLGWWWCCSSEEGCLGERRDTLREKLVLVLFRCLGLSTPALRAVDVDRGQGASGDKDLTAFCHAEPLGHDLDPRCPWI